MIFCAAKSLLSKLPPTRLTLILSNINISTRVKHINMNHNWRPSAPCKVGDMVSTIDTPALIVDLDKLSKNLITMQETMQKYNSVQVRPHAKAHKCPPLARLQVDHGAVGICCQTLTEAEALVYGIGIEDILISNQLIGKPKLRRLAKLAASSKISICVDDVHNIRDISDVAKEAGVTIDCVVEVNVGQNRCGVEPGEPAISLVKVIQDLPNVSFKGIQCYQGLNQHIRKAHDRQSAVDKVVELTKQTLQALKASGIQCDYVTGGGTGTFLYESGSGVFTEVQPGSYVFMDADYGRNLDTSGGMFRDFQQSLFVLSTVQSVSGSDRAVVDAGMKAVSLDSGVPLVRDHEDVAYDCGGDEHGILKPGTGFKVGELVWLIPGHCDPTVNLYDWLIGVRGGKVEALWPVLGRGPGV